MRTYPDFWVLNSPSPGGRGLGVGDSLQAYQAFHPHPSPPPSRGREKKTFKLW
jgi:hypothetical protein